MRTKKKKIVVTGASGFTGSQLIPHLVEAECQLLLVGRSTEDLSQKFPGIPACTYQELPKKALGFEMLVHLAGLHSGNALDEETTKQANVELPVLVARSAVEAGIPVMLLRSSTHALELDRDSIYTLSKREAIDKLQAIDGLQVQIVYMPLVYGEQWTGRFSVLNLLPGWIARSLFSAMAAFKPTCNINKFAAFILDGAPKESLILSDRQLNNSFYSGVMRSIDLVFAAAVLFFLGWLLALVWAFIRLGSAGPGIFAQTRIGKEGKEFVCYKFRTMQHGTPQVGTHEISETSVTKVGKFLRKTKFDELPQIINIFRNEISLIGPRPCLPTQVELVSERRSRGVLDIKPGISGFAQINDIDMSSPVRLAEWDEKYLELRCISLDLKIAMATIRGRGQGDKTKNDQP